MIVWRVISKLSLSLIEREKFFMFNNNFAVTKQPNASPELDLQEQMRIKCTPSMYVVNNPRVQLQEPVLEYNYGDGRDYVSAVPDISNPKFNQEIANAGGLENVIQKYPYQQLKIDNNGKLAPVNQNLGYDPTITNAYHVMYHSNLNKQKQYQEEQRKKAAMEDIAPGSTTPNIFVPHYNRPGAIAKKLVDINDVANPKEEEMYGPSLFSLVDMGDKKEELYGYEKIEQAYHMEPEQVVADYRVLQENHIVYDPAQQETYMIDNNRIPEVIDVSNPTNVVFKHPNPDYNKAPEQIQQQQFQQANPGYNYYGQSIQPMVQYPQANQVGQTGYNYDNGINPNLFGWNRNDQAAPFGSTPTATPGLANLMLSVFNPETGKDEWVHSGGQPTQSNLVNFSDMNSAKGKITNNAAANNMRNPNIQYGGNVNTYNPYQARNNSLWFNTQSTYNNGFYTPNYYGAGSATPGKNPIQQTFSHLTDFDYKHGLGIKVAVRNGSEKVVTKRERDLKAFGHTPEPKRKLTYLEKLTQVPTVRVYTFKNEESDKEKEPIFWDKNSMQKYTEAMKKVIELKPTNEESAMMKDHPMKLSEEDKKMAEQIADHMEEWDEVYAALIRMYAEDDAPKNPAMSWMSQEHFYVFMRLARGRIKWLQRMDILDKSKNYHRDYRYLQIPLEMINPNDPNDKKYAYREEEHDYFELREVDKNGNVYHVVDHGEELPDDVRKAFLNDMNTQIKYRVEAMRIYEKSMWLIKEREGKKLNDQVDNDKSHKRSNSVCGYEIDGSNYGKDKTSENSSFNGMNYNYMSYGARMYYERQEQQRREHQKMVDNQKMVFRKAFGNSMTEKQFNDFWYGPQNNPDNQLDPVWKRQQELAAVTRANIATLSKAKPYPENSEEILNGYEIKKLREMDKGCMEGVTELKDYFDNFGYLVNLCEMDDSKQKQKEKGSILYRLNQRMKANIDYMKDNFGKGLNLMKDALGIDNDMLKKVSEDCYNCLAQDEDGNSYIDLTKNETWNANREEFIRLCNAGAQDPILPRYTPLPF